MSKTIDEVEQLYIQETIECLRSKNKSLLVGSLPNYPDALKKQFGKATNFLARHPEIFDYTDPWVSLRAKFAQLQPRERTNKSPVFEQNKEQQLAPEEYHHSVQVANKPEELRAMNMSTNKIDLGQVDEDVAKYLQRVIDYLRTQKGRVNLGSLPQFPPSLKAKIGKASQLYTNRPHIFDYSPPWIALKTELIADLQHLDSSTPEIISTDCDKKIPFESLSRPVVTSNATFLDSLPFEKVGIDALIVSGDNAHFTCKLWASRFSDDSLIEIKTDTKLALFDVAVPHRSSVVEKSFSCLDLEWNAEGKVCLAQLSLSAKTAVLVDPLSHAEMGEEIMKASVLTAFAHADYVLMHDLRQDALKLGGEFFTTLFNRGTKLLDTQLASELISYLRVSQDKERETSIRDGLNAYLKKMGVTPFEGKNKHHRAMNVSSQYWEERPLSKEKIKYAASDVLLLQESIPALLASLRDLSLLHKVDMLEMLCAASRKRMEVSLATEGQRAISFLSSNFFTICSSELEPIYELIEPPSTEENNAEDQDDDEDDADKKAMHNHLLMDLGMECDLNTLLQLLPPRFQHWHEDKTQNWDEICRDLVLDCGRRPYIVTMNDRRIFLSKNATEVVSEEDIDNVVRQLGPNSFGPDNRAGIAGQLHRISAVRNKKNDIIGLTIRVGRLFHGNAFIIADLLLSTEHREHSILVLGPPGSGKTSLIREMARIMALRQTVFIVDTSNEICGDGDVVHPCVGDARRMMVPRIEDQHAVMIECLQNHSPAVMIIDEIGRASEAKAARTCKTRGVRMIASAHGDFASLMTNDEMEDLIGGKKDVTLGDETAKRNGDFKKLVTSRINPPPFDIIVEVCRGDFNSVRVIKNVAKAVDSSLQGKEVVAEERMRSLSMASEHPTFYMNLSRIKSMVL